MRNSRRGGFTLVELLAVLTLLAVLAGSVGWAIADRKHAVKLEDVMERLAFADRMARMHARQTGEEGRLEIELDEDRIVRVDGRVVFAAPSGFDLRDVRPRSMGRRVEIPIGPSGASPSYAICVKGPAGPERWILFAGRTGQTLVFDDSAPVDAVLEKVK